MSGAMRAGLIFAFFLAAITTLCCCGGEDVTAGRYVEEEITSPEGYAAAEIPFETFGKENHLKFVAAYDGSKIYEEYSNGVRTWKLCTAEGEEIILDDLNDGYVSVYCGVNCFYMCREYGIYRIDPLNGRTQFLLKSAVYPDYLFADEDMLFICHQNGVILYDLQRRTIAEKQDEVLSDFLDGKLKFSMDDTVSTLLYPKGESIYILTQGGIFAHLLYSDEVKCVLDGSFYRISDVDAGFQRLTVMEEEGRDAFYVLYSDGTLMHYYMDESLPAERRDELRVYSLYEDGNVRQAVSAFRKNYPEIGIRYEVGVKQDYGLTEGDALKNLSTELASGAGPDILVMDDIPLKSYIEKGILEDLFPLREQMSEDAYFLNVIDGFSTEKGLYVMPLSFAVPVLAGKEEEIAKLGKIHSLNQLGDKLAGIAEGTENSLINARSAQELLQIFALSSLGAWTTKEGMLNHDAVEDFFDQLKKIYDIQICRIPENMQGGIADVTEWGSGENILSRQYGGSSLADALSTMLTAFPGQSFCAGYMCSAAGFFPLTQGLLDYAGYDYVMMPGQSYGNCLPATLMAMNSASKQKENGVAFLEYVFSAQFQGSVSLNGTPVNRQAYWEKQENPKGNIRNSYMGYGCNTRDGEWIMLEIYWPAEEKFAKMDYLMENVSGVSLCDKQIYEAVIECGQKVLIGELNSKEALDAIEEKLEVYLAE